MHNPSYVRTQLVDQQVHGDFTGNVTAAREPPTCGIGLQIATKTASNGASGTPSESDATRMTTPASAAMKSVPAM